MDEVNTWFSKATRGLIQSVISKHSRFKVLIANVLYFKAKWKVQFDPVLTSCEKFTTHKGDCKTVAMMGQYGRTYKVKVYEGLFKAIRLDYEGDSFYSIAVLPDKGVAFEQLLNKGNELVDCKDAKTRFEHVKVALELPQFKVESSVKMVEYLQEQGVETAFTPAADFSRMSDSWLYISDVIHKVVVKADEYGTEAAAVSAVEFVDCGVVPEPEWMELYFNRPFLFLICHEQTNAILIAGAVLDPR